MVLDSCTRRAMCVMAVRCRYGVRKTGVTRTEMVAPGSYGICTEYCRPAYSDVTILTFELVETTDRSGLYAF